MLIMHQTNELGEVEMLEAALILHERVKKQCRNVLKGGEGMRDKDFHPKFDPHIIATASPLELTKAAGSPKVPTAIYAYPPESQSEPQYMLSFGLYI